MRLLVKKIVNENDCNTIKANDNILIIKKLNEKYIKMWFGTIDSGLWTLSKCIYANIKCSNKSIQTFYAVDTNLKTLIYDKQFLIYQIKDKTSCELLKKATTNMMMFKLLNEIYIQE